MSIPDDTVTPTPDEVPDPVAATAPAAPAAPDDDTTDDTDGDTADGRAPGDEGTILPIPGNRASTGFA